MTYSVTKKFYDLVVVGGGVAGLLFAKRIAEKAKENRTPVSLLILEAGVDLGRDPSSYKAFVDRFHQADIKSPNSPYLDNQNAPVEPDVPGTGTEYYVHSGPDKFGSNNTRALGGTTLHWMGLTPRMLPEDFKMFENFGVAVDWPIDYEDLRTYYRQAEKELGVAGDAKVSYHDEVLKDKVGQNIEFRYERRKYKTHFSPLPQARNSTPRIINRDGKPETYDIKAGAFELRAGSGQRCEGNASCIPICPVNAKYSALRTYRELQDLTTRNPYFEFDLQSQAVVTKLNTQGDNSNISSVDFYYYPHSDFPGKQFKSIRAASFVLAASAIENAKILLMSGSTGKGLANRSDQVGRNLMDHPFVLHWGLLNDKDTELGTFRGPGVTSDLPVRAGKFRAKHAAFRTDVSNWGWGLAANAPYKNLETLLNEKKFGANLRKNLRFQVQRQVTLGYLFEQLPCSKNRVTLDPVNRDRIGIPRPNIHYKIDPYTVKGMECAQALTNKVFEKAGITNHTTTDTYLGKFISSDPAERFRFIGAGHIMGTHRMGTHYSNSVVDSFQRSWDHQNLFIIGAGSMPTAGTSNPTLTLAALSLRSADEYMKCRDIICSKVRGVESEAASE